MLQINLFGVFHASRDGDPMLGLRLNSAGRLLALLALHPGRSLQNTWLAEELWPDHGSLDSLRQAIHRLREELGPERQRVTAANNSVRLDADGVDIDTRAFDAAIQRGDASSLKTAAALYKGPLLKDWDDPWARAERDSRRDRYLDALGALADAAGAAGRYTEAARHLARVVEARPRIDAGWERLVEALIKGGGRIEALDTCRRYEVYVQRIAAQRQVALEPSPRIRAIVRELTQPAEPVGADELPDMAGYEPVGGAVPLGSATYVVRPEDAEVHASVSSRQSIILVRGPRQIGKTSLLARAVQEARKDGCRVVFTDWQKLAPEELLAADAFFIALAQSFIDQLGLDADADECFASRRAPSGAFERFLRSRVFPMSDAPILWAIDEADRVFGCPFRDNVFGLFRAWHNERAYDEHGPWQRLTLAMAYATDVHLFIQNLNQSPFNVGVRVTLRDFTPAQVTELNSRHGDPLAGAADLDRLLDLVGGHPYLVRRAMHEMRKRRLTMDDVEQESAREDGMFADHLDRMLVALLTDADVADEARAILRGEEPRSMEVQARLRASGIMVPGSPVGLQPRCRLYDRFLRKHLL